MIHTPKCSFDHIMDLYTRRKSERAPVIAEMDEVRRAYNSEIVVALPELDKEERDAAPNLVRQGTDQSAMRIASVFPGIAFPPLRPGIKKSETRARTRTSATLGWHHRVGTGLKLRRRARFMLAYGTSPVVVTHRSVKDDLERDRILPWWEVRNPLGAYPAACLDLDDLVPPDCIFAYKRDRAWLEARYPEEMQRLRKDDTSRTFDVLEYLDAEEHIIGVCGDPDNGQGGYGMKGGTPHEVLFAAPNRAEMPLTVMPGRVTLDRVMGQFYDMIGMHQWQAKLMALNLIGTERSIFPDQYLVIPQGGTGEIVTPADGPRGQLGIVEGGTIANVTPGVGPYAAQAMSQLEYNQRATGSVPSEFGGQAGSNVRTGRRGEQVLSAAVDFHIQEIQELFERSLECEHKIAVAQTKAYESRPVSLHVPNRGEVTYTPEDFETATNMVRYAYAGADANALTIQVGQKLGLETLSRETAMELDPLVKDVEVEKDRIVAEKVQAAFLSNVQTMAADPNSPITPLDWANFSRLVRSDKLEPEAAFQKVHEDAQKRQAALQAQQAPPEMQPGVQIPAGMSPEAMPPVAAPSEGITNVAGLMAKLRLPNMQIPAEQRAVV